MEPRKEVLKKSPDLRQDERKRRFQIVKLEERIAPGKCCLNPQGKPTGGPNCKGL
jgi:hypothetical protein